MSADAPTILATSGGLRRGGRTEAEFDSLITYALELSGAAGRPQMCYLGTAYGDQRWHNSRMSEAGMVAGVTVTHLNVFPMPSVDNMLGHLLEQDVVWVGGGSVAGLLAMWRLHGLDEIFRAVWQAGVVLGGVSAGSICWHVGGTTDSFGPDLRPVTNGLGFLPYSNGVHYDSEQQRRPLFHKWIADGTFPAGYASDDGVGLLYRGDEFVEALSEREGKAAYYVELGPDGDAVETEIEPRLLRG